MQKVERIQSYLSLCYDRLSDPLLPLGIPIPLKIRNQENLVCVNMLIL